MINLLDNLNNDLWNEKGVVYCYTNKINNRKYVGQTNQKLIKRHKAHFSYHRDNTKRRKLSYNSFSFYYLDDYSDEKLIKEIKEFNL